MTLILDLDPGVVKMYLRNKNEVSRSRLSKLGPQTGQTTQSETVTSECNHATVANYC